MLSKESLLKSNNLKISIFYVLKYDHNFKNDKNINLLLLNLI